MIKLFISISLLVLSPVLFAQNVAPFQIEDSSAKEVSDVVLQQFMNSSWYCYDKRFVDREGVTKHLENKTLRVFKDNTFIQGAKKGKWSILENKIVLFEYDMPFENDNLEYIEGGYAIYDITDEYLVLTKVLTTSADMMITYYFEEDKVLAERFQKQLDQEKIEQLQKEIKKGENASFNDNLELGQMDDIDIIKHSIERNRLIEKSKNARTEPIHKRKPSPQEISKMSKEELFMRGIVLPE